MNYNIHIHLYETIVIFKVNSKFLLWLQGPLQSVAGVLTFWVIAHHYYKLLPSCLDSNTGGLFLSWCPLHLGAWFSIHLETLFPRFIFYIFVKSLLSCKLLTDVTLTTLSKISRTCTAFCFVFCIEIESMYVTLSYLPPAFSIRQDLGWLLRLGLSLWSYCLRKSKCWDFRYVLTHFATHNFINFITCFTLSKI